MREKKFLKELNSKYNKDGSFTYSLVKNLIEQEDNKPVSNNIFNRLISKLYKNKSYEQLITENFETILDKTNSEYKNSLLTMIMEKEDLEHIIRNKFAYIIENLSNEDPYMMKRFIKQFKEESIENKRYLKNNSMNIFLNADPIHLFENARYLKGNSEAMDNSLNNYLEHNKRDIALHILDKSTRTSYSSLTLDKIDKTKKNYVNTLQVVIDELLKSEGKRIIDIKEIQGGDYCDVYEIGDKVLKVGGVRAQYNIPNHRRILQPLTRLNFIDEDKDEIFGCLEIANKIERNPNKYEQDEENLYSIWKELREDGIIWTDIRSANIGRLRSDNIPTLSNQKMYVAPNSVGFDKELKGKPLKKGDWVILDTDFIFLESDTELLWTPRARKFEKKYQQEQQSKIAKKEREKIKKTNNNKRNLSR